MFFSVRIYNNFVFVAERHFLTVLFLLFAISRRHYNVIFFNWAVQLINYKFVDNYVRIKMVLEF